MPPKRATGELPRGGAAELAQAEEQRMQAEQEERERAASTKKSVSPVPGAPGSNPEQEAAILGAIARGEIEILKARRQGRGIVFGCPFCAKPMEIKSRQQGEELTCAECSGKLIAPDLDKEIEAEALSGLGGTAGESRVVLPQKRPGKPPAKAAGSGDDDGEAPAFDKRADHRLNDSKVTTLVPRDEAEAGFDVEDAWKSYGDNQPKLKRTGRRLKRLGIFLMIGLIAAATAASLFWLNRDPGSGAGAGGQSEEDKTPARKAIDVLDSLRSAITVKERMELVRNPEEAAPRMRRYYSRFVVDAEIPPMDALSYIESEVRGVKLARLTSIIRPGAPVRNYFFELMEDGRVLLDWESAVGYGDMDIIELGNSTPQRPLEMRLQIRPADYYNHEFGNAATHACFQMTDLRGRLEIYGYAMIGGEVEKFLTETHASVAGNDPKAYVNATLVISLPDGHKRRNPMQMRIDSLADADGWLKP